MGSNSGSTTKLELKFAPHNPGKSSTATYATVKEHIVEYIQKSYMQAGVDVSKSLKKMKWIDFATDEPVRFMSALTESSAKREEQEFLDRMHQERFGRHLDRMKQCNDAMCRAYALIKSQFCSKTMQTQIEEHPDYESKIEDDPIALFRGNQNLDARPCAGTTPVCLVGCSAHYVAEHEATCR